MIRIVLTLIQLFFIVFTEFLCEECGKSFNSAHNLNIHKVFHLEPMIQCPDCPRKLYSQHQLKRHSDQHNEFKYVCEICGSELISLLGYNDHMR